MTDRQKKMKAALAAVAYYLEQEAQQDQPVANNAWSEMGKEIIMKNRAMVQRRGRVIRSRA